MHSQTGGEVGVFGYHHDRLKSVMTLTFFFTSQIPEGQQPERIKERSIVPIAHQATPRLPPGSEAAQTQRVNPNSVT